LLFASWPKISKRPRRRHRTVAPHKLAPSTAACHSDPSAAKWRNLQLLFASWPKISKRPVADHSGITIHWVSFHEEEGNFKVMTGQERVMRTMKYAFIVSVLLFVLVTIQVPSKAAHPPAHSLELIVIVLALTNLALGLAGRPILSRLIKANAARDGNKAPQISGCLRTSSASH
jgi:hypothetical protein